MLIVVQEHLDIRQRDIINQAIEELHEAGIQIVLATQHGFEVCEDIKYQPLIDEDFIVPAEMELPFPSERGNSKEWLDTLNKMGDSVKEGIAEDI